MSQDISKQKRLWLKRILNRSVCKAWLGSALLSPLLLTSAALGQVGAQELPTSQPAAAVQSNVDAAFVLGWIDYSIQRLDAGDQTGAARAWAEAVRARKMLNEQDPQVETRIKKEEQYLLSKGMQRQQILDAWKALGPVAAPPTMAPSAVTTALGTSAAGQGVKTSEFSPQRDSSATQPAAAQVALPSP
ncbi:MAG: hypothetical protein AAF483_28175, partial [Planctomycetota bacterium]